VGVLLEELTLTWVEEDLVEEELLCSMRELFPILVQYRPMVEQEVLLQVVLIMLMVGQAALDLLLPQL
jgi:hypothetical protein